MEEIDEINREEILTQLSEENSSVKIVNDINKFDQEDKVNKSYIHDMPSESVNIRADPEVKIPEKISPTSSTNLEVLFHKLGEIIKKSMEKQTAKEINYEESQKRKAWKELDSNMKKCVLNGSSSQGVCPAEEPEDSLLSIITKMLPARVLTHLYFVLNKCDIVIVQGLVTALSRTILLSTLTWRNVSNFKSFFRAAKK